MLIIIILYSRITDNNTMEKPIRVILRSKIIGNNTLKEDLVNPFKKN